MHMCEQWWLHCTSQGGSNHCWVSMCTVWPSHSKWQSKWSNESASDFALSLNIPPWKLFRWFRRPQLWATGDWQLRHDKHLLMYHVSCRAFWQNIKSPRWLSALQLGFGTLQLLAFHKTKITFEREEISDHQWDSGKYDVTVDGDGRTVWSPKVPTLKETEVSLSYVQRFLYFVSSINASIFHITWMDTFWTDLIYSYTLNQNW